MTHNRFPAFAGMAWIFALLFFGSARLHAQNFEDQIDSIFAGVDLNQVPNGILYEHGFPWTHFGYWEGQLKNFNSLSQRKLTTLLKVFYLNATHIL